MHRDLVAAQAGTLATWADEWRREDQDGPGATIGDLLDEARIRMLVAVGQMPEEALKAYEPEPEPEFVDEFRPG
jgi:hypothetical protein